MARAYYPARPSGQMQSVYTRPAVGLNAYTPNTAVNENFMTDMLNAANYREEAIKLHLPANIDATVKTLTDFTDIILQYVSMIDSSGDTHFVFLCVDVDWTSYFIVDYNETDDDYDRIATGVSYGGVSVGSPGSEISDQTASFQSAVFSTEASHFAVFVGRSTGSTTDYRFMYYDLVSEENGDFSVTFAPKFMVAHAGRLFVADTRNTIWWCKIGDFFSWYGMEYDDDALKASGNMADGAYAITGSIRYYRPVTAKVIKVGDLDTLGYVVIADADNTEELTLAEGRVQTLKSFTGTVTITQYGHSAGGSADLIEFGTAPFGGYVTEDAGFWTLEQERYIQGLAVIDSVLVVFANNGIYAFSGYSPETFALTLLTARVTCDGGATAYNNIAVANNRIYFLSLGEVYEYDLSGYRIISRPVYSNNALTNGVMGGIPEVTSADYRLTADKDNLYVYQRFASASLGDGLVYLFRFRERTWWKMQGLNEEMLDISAVVRHYIARPGNNGIANMVIGSGKRFYSEPFVYRDTDAYIVTKAFNSMPSQEGTLSSIILMVQGDADDTCDINVFYSKTTNGDDFVELYHAEDYLFTGDIEIINIPLPVAFVHNTHHYRLKITADGDPLYVYNIERRFRVKGMSR